MTAAEVQALIAGLPAGRELFVLIVRPSSLDSSAGHSVSTSNRMPSSVSVAQPTSAFSQQSSADSPSPATPLDVAEKINREAPGESLTFAQWSDRLGGAIKVRELKRAVDGGILRVAERGSGRGHAAKVIAPADMLSYLELRVRVLDGAVPTPSWFFTVVRGGRREND